MAKVKMNGKMVRANPTPPPNPEPLGVAGAGGANSPYAGPLGTRPVGSIPFYPMKPSMPPVAPVVRTPKAKIDFKQALVDALDQFKKGWGTGGTTGTDVTKGIQEVLKLWERTKR